MTVSEKVGNKHYYQDQLLVAEQDPDGRYRSVFVTNEQFESEGITVLERSRPPRFASRKVLLIKSAEHENAHLMPTPHASFGRPFASNIEMSVPRPGRDVRPGRDGGNLGLDDGDLSGQLEHWRFLARFEVLPNGDRTGEVVWSPAQVPQWWMNVLEQNLALASDEPGDHRVGDHRVTVYAVVEVGKIVTVRQRMSFLPRCCCTDESQFCV